MGSTTVELIEDLKKEAEKAGGSKSKMIWGIINNAKLGYYHDFKSPLPTPKIRLHADLISIGLVEIDKKMQAGEYDE